MVPKHDVQLKMPNGENTFESFAVSNVYTAIITLNMLFQARNQGGGVRGVRPNPPFCQPPSKNYEPPPTSIFPTVYPTPSSQVGPLMSIVSTPTQHTVSSLGVSSNRFPNPLQHYIWSSNYVKSHETSQKSQTHRCWRIVGISSLFCTSWCSCCCQWSNYSSRLFYRSISKNTFTNCLHDCIQYSKWGLTIALYRGMCNQSFFFLCYISPNHSNNLATLRSCNSALFRNFHVGIYCYPQVLFVYSFA